MDDGKVGIYRYFKRVIGFVISLIGFIVLIPVFLILIECIKIGFKRTDFIQTKKNRSS